VKTPGLNIVVDTCVGNDKPRRLVPFLDELQTAFLAKLEAAGCRREQVDVVLCTHLHVDHVGWNTMLLDGAWVPTFPNARYLIGRAEYEHWRSVVDEIDRSGATDPMQDFERQTFADSVQPIVDAGLVELVEADHRICPEVSLRSTPGHTPGHVSVDIESAGRRGLITGDFVHHPCQITHPALVVRQRPRFPGGDRDAAAGLRGGRRRRLSWSSAPISPGRRRAMSYGTTSATASGRTSSLLADLEGDAVVAADLHRVGLEAERAQSVADRRLASQQQAAGHRQALHQHGVMPVVPAVGAVAHIDEQMGHAVDPAHPAPRALSSKASCRSSPSRACGPSVG